MNVTQEELSEILSNNNVVVVDFWAPWCGPCRILGPNYEKFAEANPDVAIHKLQADAEGNEEAPKIYGVRGLPTIAFFKEGVEVARLNGVQTVDSLQTKLEEVLNG